MHILHFTTDLKFDLLSWADFFPIGSTNPDLAIGRMKESMLKETFKRKHN